MDEQLETPDYETEFEVGQDNVEVLGFDVHNPVFFLSAGLVLLFAGATLAFPDSASGAFNGAKTWTLAAFDWLFAITPIVALAFCALFAFSPLGSIRLGGADARPEFGMLSWIAMLFAAGVGIGYMFYGAAEPLAYYTNWFGTPFNVEPGTPEARRLAFTTTVFHWGLSPWAIYAIVGLAFSFFAYNKGLPLTIRSAFYPLLGDRAWGWPGHIIDLVAVIATIFGLATSIGLGATQATSGIAYLAGVEPTLTMQMTLIAVITGAAVVSVIRGLDGGVKLLSNINMVVAFILLVFVIAICHQLSIFARVFENLAHYIPDAVRLSSWIGREDQAFFHDWTIFYWAWWIAWAPFVGMFIARISRGRTVREFIIVVLTAPLLIGVIWFTAFGEAAITLFDAGTGDIAQPMTDASLVLFHMLHGLPFATLTSVIAIALLVIFITTSADSGALVVDSITAGGKTTAPVAQRIFWTVMLGVTAAALLFGGGSEVLTSLQAGSITAGLPFTAILLVSCWSLFIGLRLEYMQLREAKRELRAKRKRRKA